MVQAVWNGVVIAESDDTVVVVEGNHYFPPESVRQDLLEGSSTTSRCPWKGHRQLLHIVSGGQRNPRCRLAL